ncbi:hypothetical protein M0805_006434 [Coniferiporia weirii]|nr:hypothetical protein M0805_006434 [Coniferiporia weirii]
MSKGNTGKFVALNIAVARSVTNDLRTIRKASVNNSWTSVQRPKSDGLDVESEHRYKDALKNLLKRLHHLDLTGRIYDIGNLMVARGGYGRVFIGYVNSSALHKAQWRKGSISRKVAIKRIDTLERNVDAAKILFKEMHVWSKLGHPNVLSFFGFMIEGENVSLISEWIENGSLRNYLVICPGCNIEKMALGIAEGLAYLHKEEIVHSDLKLDNILVDQSGKPLICDFGVSRILIVSQTLAGLTLPECLAGLGTTRWMARELLNYDPDNPNIIVSNTKETDIWSYGMTLYELLAKEIPYAYIEANHHVLIAITKGALPKKPHSFISWSSSFKDMWAICERCWKRVPGERPVINQIIGDLRSICQLSAPGGSSNSSNTSSSQSSNRLSLVGKMQLPFNRRSYTRSTSSLFAITGTTEHLKFSPSVSVHDLYYNDSDSEDSHDTLYFSVTASGRSVASRLWWTTEPFSASHLGLPNTVRLSTLSGHQGWVSFPNRGSWSWFELAIVSSAPSQVAKVYGYNLVKTRANGTLLKWFSHRHPIKQNNSFQNYIGRLLGTEHEIWRYLSPGDRLAVFGCAQYPAWSCRGQKGVLTFNESLGREMKSKSPKP